MVEIMLNRSLADRTRNEKQKQATPGQIYQNQNQQLPGSHYEKYALSSLHNSVNRQPLCIAAVPEFSPTFIPQYASTRLR